MMDLNVLHFNLFPDLFCSKTFSLISLLNPVVYSFFSISARNQDFKTTQCMFNNPGKKIWESSRETLSNNGKTQVQYKYLRTVLKYNY